VSTRGCGAPRARARRAVRRGRVCNKLGGSAGRRLSQRRRVPCSKQWGNGARVGRAPCWRRGRPKQQRQRRRGRPREAHAAAHPRMVPVHAPSKADHPPELRLVAVACGLVHGLVAAACGLTHGLAHRVAHRVLGTGAAHLFCAVVASSAGGARESADEFP
jgi:hypothetical protein